MKIFKLNYLTKLFLALLFVSLNSCQNDDADFIKETEQTTNQKENSSYALSARVGDFLNQQESLGGHTIERHVGKTTQFLRDRLSTSSISAASTYTTISSAEGAIINGLNANSSAVSSWKRNSTSRYTINYTNSTNVGVVLNRGAANPVSSKKIVVVLQKKSTAPNGYYVLTSYPTN
jgi:hypothetical protein